MSQQLSSDSVHAPSKDKDSSPSNSRAEEPYRMVNPSDLVLDIAPLSIIPASTHEEATAYASRYVRTSGKSSFSSNDRNRSDIDMEKEPRKINPIKSSVANKSLDENNNRNFEETFGKFVNQILRDSGVDVIPDV